MKTFHVYRHPMRGYEAVKIGFSWPAFVWGYLGISIVWLAFKRLWVYAGIWLAAYVAWGAVLIVLAEANGAVSDGALALIGLLMTSTYLVLWFVPAFMGDSWRITNLKARGCELAGRVPAASKREALAKVAKATAE